MVDNKKYDFASLAVRAGWWDVDSKTGAVSPPISQTSTYAFNKVEDVSKIIESGD